CGARTPGEIISCGGREQREPDMLCGTSGAIYRGNREAEHQIQIALARIAPGDTGRTRWVDQRDRPRSRLGKTLRALFCDTGDRMSRGGKDRYARKAERLGNAVEHRDVEIVFAYINSGYGLGGADRVTDDSSRDGYSSRYWRRPPITFFT